MDEEYRFYKSNEQKYSNYYIVIIIVNYLNGKIFVNLWLLQVKNGKLFL